MNKTFSLSIGLALLVAVAGCKQNNGGGSTSATYTCTMHPEVTSDKPGNCPKCGMALVQKK